jgi:hypothetical protein
MMSLSVSETGAKPVPTVEEIYAGYPLKLRVCGSRCVDLALSESVSESVSESGCRVSVSAVVAVEWCI